jgi:hypothetical protein
MDKCGSICTHPDLQEKIAHPRKVLLMPPFRILWYYTSDFLRIFNEFYPEALRFLPQTLRIYPARLRLVSGARCGAILPTRHGSREKSQNNTEKGLKNV